MKTSLEDFRLALRSWTDGPKLIVDTMNIHAVHEIAKEENIHFLAYTHDAVMSLIRGYPYRVGTFFVVCHEEDGQFIDRLKSVASPSLDIRHFYF